MAACCQALRAGPVRAARWVSILTARLRREKKSATKGAGDEQATRSVVPVRHGREPRRVSARPLEAGSSEVAAGTSWRRRRVAPDAEPIGQRHGGGALGPGRLGSGTSGH
jgi:hypothetical protein